MFENEAVVPAPVIKIDTPRQKMLERNMKLTSSPVGVHRWRCRPIQGTTLKQMLEPEYWSLVAYRFAVKEGINEGAIVEILPEDHAFYAELIVLNASNIHAVVETLFYKELKAKRRKSMIKDGYEVKLRGPKKWSIIRVSDKVVVDEDIPTEIMAWARLEEVLKELVA